MNDVINLEMSGPLSGLLHQQVNENSEVPLWILMVLCLNAQLQHEIGLFIRLDSYSKAPSIAYDFYISVVRLPQVPRTFLPLFLAGEAEEKLSLRCK